MSTTNDFTRGLREESQSPPPASSGDHWPRAGAEHAVVQRDLTTPLSDGATARQINLDAVRPDPNQPRRIMDPQKLEELADSIREHGVLQPITVTWSDADRAYLIVTGQRRYEAAKSAGLTSIPAIIRPATYDESQRLQQQIVENIQREGIPPIDEARAVKTLMDAFNLSQRAVAKKLAKPLTYVAELLQILRVPDELLARGQRLPKQALVQVSRVKTPEEQEAFIDLALSSDAPWKAVQDRRAEREPRQRLHYFKKTYPIHGTAGSITVSIQKHPDEVTPDDVVHALMTVARALVGKEGPGR